MNDEITNFTTIIIEPTTTAPTGTELNNTISNELIVLNPEIKPSLVPDKHLRKQWILVALLSSIVILLLTNICLTPTVTPPILNHHQPTNTPHPSSTPSHHIQSLAIVRPFATRHLEPIPIHHSFDQWDTYPPCNNTTSHLTNTTVILSYSQSYTHSPSARLILSSSLSKLHSSPWSHCLRDSHGIAANIPQEDDLYDPSVAGENVMWVNGPNRQFVNAFRRLRGEGYEVMYLMEADSIPVGRYWLDDLLREAEERRPFGILGSKYDGDSWDRFKNELPPSLVHHINGNAMYNLSHPLLNLIVDELAKEATTIYNSIPFDYRISQIIHEMRDGIPPVINDKLLGNITGGERRRRLLGSKERFEGWWERYGGEGFVSESKVISNVASTNLLPKHVKKSEAKIIHGAKYFSPWNQTTHNITLVISEWQHNLSTHLLTSLSTSTHPFSSITLILPPSQPTPPIPSTLSLPLTTHHRRQLDEHDLCSAPIESEWFMMTNSYHILPNSVDLLFTLQNNKPVIPYTPGTKEHCFIHKGCDDAFRQGRSIYDRLDFVVQDGDMLFRTKMRDEFCRWFREYHQVGEDDVIMPSATSYAAYLLSRDEWHDSYETTDRTSCGSRDFFVKVFHEEEGGRGRRRRRMVEWSGNETTTVVVIGAEKYCKEWCETLPIEWRGETAAKCDWLYSCGGCKPCQED